MHWKISDFVEEVKMRLHEERLHLNTVDGWFKKLEERRFHYICRTEETNEKIYDELDLKIAIFIKKKRNQKWSLDAIFQELKQSFDLRPFPEKNIDFINAPQMVNIENLKIQLIKELSDVYEKVAASQAKDLKNHYEHILNQLPKPKTREEEREERFQEIVAKSRVEAKLEEEAIHIWTTKPERERYKKVGLLKKEEDWIARQQFVKSYIQKHFADKLRKEFDLD